MKSFHIAISIVSLFLSLQAFAQADGRASTVDSVYGSSSTQNSSLNQFLDKERKSRQAAYREEDPTQSVVYQIDLRNGFDKAQQRSLADQIEAQGRVPDQFALAISGAASAYHQNKIIAFIQKKAEEHRRKTEAKLKAEKQNSMTLNAGHQSQVENAGKENLKGKFSLKTSLSDGGKVMLVYRKSFH